VFEPVEFQYISEESIIKTVKPVDFQYISEESILSKLSYRLRLSTKMKNQLSKPSVEIEYKDEESIIKTVRSFFFLYFKFRYYI
jgi:hypothetical protein